MKYFVHDIMHAVTRSPSLL